MSKISDLNHQFRAIDHNLFLSNHKKKVFVDAPLRYVGDALKDIFSYVIGFKWFLNFSHGFGLSESELTLWTIAHHNERDPDTNRLISGFSISEITYSINLINWWAMPVNFIARNLGKALGWLIVSPFTIPAYLAIKGYYGLKHLMLERRIDDLLKETEPEDLAKDWFSSFYEGDEEFRYLKYEERIAQYVGPKEIFKEGVKFYKSVPSMFLYQSKIHNPINAYGKLQKEVFQSKRAWSLAKTILSGILIAPLFFTIPAHMKLIREQKEKITLWEEKKNILSKLTYGDPQARADILRSEGEDALADLFSLQGFVKKEKNDSRDDGEVSESEGTNTEKDTSSVSKESHAHTDNGSSPLLRSGFFSTADTFDDTADAGETKSLSSK